MPLRVAIAVTGLLWLAPPVPAQEHPFTLVNIIDLYEVHHLNFNTNGGQPAQIIVVGDGYTQPPNVAPVSESRIGTNPSAIATDGERLWVAGFYNGNDIGASTPEGRAASWYASVGVAEIRNIARTSGYALSDIVRYESTFKVGPGVGNTDWFSGLDYDEDTQTLYVAYDDAKPFASPGILDFLTPPQTQEPSYVAAIDANTNSVSYAQILWRMNTPVLNPPNPPSSRLTGGVSIDPLHPDWISVANIGNGFVNFYDTLHLANPPLYLDIYDEDSGCASSAFLNHEYDPGTGNFYSRTRNGVQLVERSGSGAPFTGYTRFIVQPPGGNGLADTAKDPLSDDVQEIAVGQPAGDNAIIVSGGPNGKVDTLTLQGDDQRSTRVYTTMLVGNTAASYPGGCLDEDGFTYTSTTQGQGIAYIPKDNLEGVTQDLIIAGSRPTFGVNQVTDIRFFNTNGDTVATLELPCTVPASTTTGLAFYDIDYHAPSGTLVVADFETRRVFVYRAQLKTGPAYPPFDYDRDLDVDLHDFWGFQQCYTGAEYTGPTLSTNCQRMNSDSDCEIDLDDWAAMSSVIDSIGGP